MPTFFRSARFMRILTTTTEEAFALADEMQDGEIRFLIERALDEARSSQFRPVKDKK